MPSDRDADGVRGEAARSAGRLTAARDLLADLLPAGTTAGGAARVEGSTPVDGAARGGDSAPTRGPGRVGVARIDDDDELRALVQPAAARVARLAGLAGALAAGTLSDEDAAEAARAVADAQPHRHPR